MCVCVKSKITKAKINIPIHFWDLRDMLDQNESR